MGAEKLLNDPCVKLVVKGDWNADDLVVWPLFQNRSEVPIFTGLKDSITNNWREIRNKNPQAFAGPTIRMANYHRTGELLVVEVIPSDYAEGQFLGWQGVAMVVPVTSDRFIAMQANVQALAASIGGGIRVPGCTPPHHYVIDHIIKEMDEGFAVEIDKNQLHILGIGEVIPPAAKRNNWFIVHIDLKETYDELRQKWQDAEDKWEGEILPFSLTKENVLAAIEDGKYARVSKMCLLVVGESFGII